MDGKRFFIVILSIGAWMVSAACVRDLDPVSTANSGDSCLYAIPPWPSDPSFDGFHVVVDGAFVPQDATIGWTLTDATQRVIPINGPTCDAIQAGTVQTV